jgi:putative tributyrin esterase
MAFYRGTYYSPSVDMDHEVNIIIPDDIKEGERLKSLYLLHGYMGNHQQWMRFTSIERYAWEKRMCIIMPEAQNGLYIKHAYGFDHFGALLDVMHHVEKLFPLSKSRDDRYVCGLSMGGYGALKWALTKPDIFSKAASLSGALDIFRMKKWIKDGPNPNRAIGLFGDDDLSTSENNLYHLLNNLLSLNKTCPDLFIACGTEDFLYQETLDFKHHLEQQNINFTYKESKGGHEWSFWDTYIQKVIEWL